MSELLRRAQELKPAVDKNNSELEVRRRKQDLEAAEHNRLLQERAQRLQEFVGIMVKANVPKTEFHLRHRNVAKLLTTGWLIEPPIRHDGNGGYCRGLFVSTNGFLLIVPGLDNLDNILVHEPKVYADVNYSARDTLPEDPSVQELYSNCSDIHIRDHHTILLGEEGLNIIGMRLAAEPEI